jgi:hypothetical protein
MDSYERLGFLWVLEEQFRLMDKGLAPYNGWLVLASGTIDHLPVYGGHYIEAGDG